MRMNGRLTLTLAILVLLGGALGACADGGTKNRGGGGDSRELTPAERSLFKAAELSEAAGEHEAAVEYYQRLLQVMPENPNVIRGLSRVLRLSGRGLEARLFIEMVMREQKGGERYMAELGKAQLADARPEAAAKSLNRAISLGDRNWQTLSALGIAYDRLERFRMAQDAYQQALILSPENPSILNNLALSLAISGRLPEGLAMLKDLVRRPGVSPQVRQNLALLHALTGNEAAAEELGKEDLSEEDVRQNLKYYQSFTGSR